MNYNTEIRKLNPKDLFNLVQILEYDESWKKLMAVIPKTLTLDDYECKITFNNLPKYSTDHFKLIDSAGYKYKKPCSEILLDEWGTSGRIRPRLGHLITLLRKTELYRAADFVAVNLLKMAEVDRPLCGPAAKVNIPRDDQLIHIIPPTNYPSSLLEADPLPSSVFNEILAPAINYPSSLLGEAAISSSLYNQIAQSPHIVPKIIVNNAEGANFDNNSNFTLSNEDNNNIPAFSDLLQNSQDNNRSDGLNDNSTNITDENNVSAYNIPDLSAINLSTALDDIQDLKSINIPNLTVLNDNFAASDSTNDTNIIPNFSALQTFDHQANTSSNLPNLSILQNVGLSNNLPNLSAMLSQTESEEINKNREVPDFSLLNINEASTNIPAFSQILTSENSSVPLINNIPQLSDLLTIGDKKVDSDNAGSNSTITSFRTCPSPLPNLSLNTLLPHFTYQQLEQSTKNFDETILSDQESNNLNQAAKFGRKLGSGAFGTVYLGIGLLEKPVAVKKLNLNGVNVVNVDDTITKQFRNEVELLCKYKHENLLSLLGYSCDGPTYCLIYEYICGGALKDRLINSLQSPDKFRLLWTDRLYIAFGTAKAVSYLHNAYSMPLIHRDIKSANILLDGVNKPKLCDFGLIKLTPNPNTNTSTTVFGTSAYMAPEAFRGDMSVKLDTFSFGVVLLELLTSLPPLDEHREGNDLVTHVEEVCENNITPLLDMNAGSWLVDNTHFADELYDIANQCLEEKKRRPFMSVVVSKLSELIQKSVT